METLRYVRMVTGPGEVYTLHTWYPGHGCIIAYEFIHNGKLLFEGDDFGCSPLNAIDSDECLRSLLGFLILRPGDTDREYFQNYTAEQMAFAESDAEYLVGWVDGSEAFEDIDE